MLKVALTGGIASGKSTIADLFRQRDVAVIDTDEIAREVVAVGEPALEKIREAFGEEFIHEDETLNRRMLREHIFSTPTERERLNAILHPAIMERLGERLLELQDEAYVIVEVPLLVEGGFEKDFDRILVVDTPRKEQVRRLLERDGVDHDSANQAIAAQADRNERLAVADDIIVNDGPPDALAAEVDKLDARYRREFASKAGPASE